ncbi:Hydrogen cyanide synthase subunit HcnB [Pseudovibrio axinellae]|uniref:Hydrogen cyanide synthase subunit HcnB n=1 Tax=Pseudovibrio axinellae TaxID=989403 RepID=A0A166BCX5_9HYPH|nr:NAD(P)/FAD-dependent oxidoreductase [Pseudovibrio axinellae]KZL22137.1 Hydrogen cyanide synthase subunit HcnB [Pseudovibrio axinellae]SEQ53803.1 Thioredoxin reductase [Pseudovibrio axinellae]
MTKIYDTAVLGSGPAGANAALKVSECGLSVVLLDEQPAVGGQVWRAKSSAILSAPKTSESVAGDALRTSVATACIEHKGDTRVWQIERDDANWMLYCVSGGKNETITAKTLILAAGAQEYVQPVPGWTTPGVIGLAGATALLKQELQVPAGATIVSGSGPLVFFAASEIRRLGGKVKAVITPNSFGEWLNALPAMLSKPGLLMRGLRWIADLKLAGVPIYWRHAVSRVYGQREPEFVSIQALDQDWSPIGETLSLQADSLCLGNGLVPSVEAAQLAGLPLIHAPALGGWVPEVKEDGRTAEPGLFVCGDMAGIRGAAAAEIHGALAGLSAASYLGKDAAKQRPALLRSYHKAARFGLAMSSLSIPRKGLNKLSTSQTIMCRCESIKREEVLEEVASGAQSTSAVKSGLRAGMGPCGGKYCQLAIARLIAAEVNQDEAEIGPPTPRPPLRPVPVDALAGTFKYSDLPIPRPAPL